MTSWTVSQSDKAWDFDENESCDNVVFLDGPVNHKTCYVSAGSLGAQHSEYLPSTSGTNLNDGQLYIYMQTLLLYSNEIIVTLSFYRTLHLFF